MTEPTIRKAPYPGWHDFVAGAVAGGGARILTHPLDLIRIRRQLAATWSHPETRPNTSLWQDFVGVIQNEGGIRGLFRGTVAGLNLWVTYTAVQFYAYGFTKKYFESVFPNNDNPTLVAFCSGASAGVTATITTYPLDLCRTIFAAKGASSVESSIAAGGGGGVEASKAPKNTRDFATYLYQRRGWRGFYAGCAPTVVQVIPYLGCSFAIYDGLTRGDRNVGLSAYAGSIAGATSKTLVYPMDTVKKRMQSQAFFGNPQQLQRQYVGILDCVTTIYKVEGASAFYNGLVPSVLKTALAAGFSFAFFRSTKNLLESIHDRPFTEEDPPTRRTITRRLTTGQ